MVQRMVGQDAKKVSWTENGNLQLKTPTFTTKVSLAFEIET